MSADRPKPQSTRPASQQGGKGASSDDNKPDAAGLGRSGRQAGGFGGQPALVWLGGAGLLAAAIVSVGLLGSPVQRDGIGDEDRQRAAQSSTASLIQPVASSEREQAIARLMMSGPEKEKVKEELSRGKLRLGLITLSDIQEEDGDWVRLEAAGFRQDVRLLHKAYTVAVPYLPGTSITVMGLVDGGGGDITVAVYVGTGQVSLRPLKKGETLQIPAP